MPKHCPHRKEVPDIKDGKEMHCSHPKRNVKICKGKCNSESCSLKRK